MIIRFERSGGFAGMLLRAEIDVQELEPHEREEIHRLVAEAGFFELPPRLQSAGGGADRFQYVLSIEEPGGRSHTLEVSEEAVPPDLQPLIERVAYLARRSRRQSC